MSEYRDFPNLLPARPERQDVPPKWIALVLAGVFTILLAVAGFVAWLFPASLADQTISGPPQPYPAPRLQTSPRADMAAFFQQQMQAVNGVWFVDRAHSIVHIPIGHAMRLLAVQGIPDWPTQPQDPAPRDPLLRNGSP